MWVGVAHRGHSESATLRQRVGGGRDEHADGGLGSRRQPHLVFRVRPSSAHASIGAALPWAAGGFEPPRTLCPIRRGAAMRLCETLRPSPMTLDDKQSGADLRHKGAA